MEIAFLPSNYINDIMIEKIQKKKAGKYSK